MKEEWRSIEGYEGIYEVSSIGRVRRLDGTDYSGRQPISGHLISPKKCSGGYLQVCLSYGIAKQFLVHRLVANAFLQKDI